MKGRARDRDGAPLCALTPGGSPSPPMTKLTLLAVLGLAFLAGCEAAPESTADAYGPMMEPAPLAEDVALTDPAFDADLAPPPQAQGLTDAEEAAESEPSDLNQRSRSSASPASPPPSALAGRSLRRSASLVVAADDYQATLRQARAIAPQFGGLVTGETGATDADFAQTTLTLRVPSDRFDAAVDALAALGEVESRSVSVDDVTSQAVDLRARIRAKRAAEARYVGFVGQAGSISEMLDVQRQLDGVRSEIETMESHLRSLEGAVSLSTIRATFVGPALVAPPPPAPGVWTRAVDGVALGWNGILAVVLGLLPLWPVAVLGSLGVAAWRRWQQRPVAV